MQRVGRTVLLAVVVGILGLASGEVHAGGAPSSTSSLAPIKSVLQKYHSAPGVSMRLKKRVRLGLLNQENLSEGRFYFSRGRLRLEMEKPTKTTVVIDGKHVWVVDELGKEMGGGVQVARTGATRPKERWKSPLAFVFKDLKVWDEFRVVGQQVEGSLVTYSLRPKKEEDWSQVRKMAIKIDRSAKVVASFSFWDDLENETSFIFTEADFSAPIKEELLHYKPPAGVMINEY